MIIAKKGFKYNIIIINPPTKQWLPELTLSSDFHSNDEWLHSYDEQSHNKPFYINKQYIYAITPITKGGQQCQTEHSGT